AVNRRDGHLRPHPVEQLRRLCGRRPCGPEPRFRPVRLLLPSEPAHDDRHRRPRDQNVENLSGWAPGPVLGGRKPEMIALVDLGAVLMMMRKARSTRTHRTAPWC